jgi:hypothetical protein
MLVRGRTGRVGGSQSAYGSCRIFQGGDPLGENYRGRPTAVLPTPSIAPLYRLTAAINVPKGSKLSTLFRS